MVSLSYSVALIFLAIVFEALVVVSVQSPEGLGLLFLPLTPHAALFAHL